MAIPSPVLTAAACGRLIEAVRLELAEAGNPAFMVIIVDADGHVHSSPLVLSAVGPASAHAERVAASTDSDESVLIISRHASRTRQTYNVLDPATLRKLHIQDEVIELTFAQTDGLI